MAAEWTLEADEQALLPTRLARPASVSQHCSPFSATKAGSRRASTRCPHAVVKHVASQVGVPAEAYIAYDWQGRTIKYHRVRIRAALGLREAGGQDAGRATSPAG